MPNLNNLEAKASKISKKSESTKKGMDFLFGNIKGPIEVDKRVKTRDSDSHEEVSTSTEPILKDEQKEIQFLLKKIEEEQVKLSEKEKELEKREREFFSKSKTIISVIVPIIENKERMFCFGESNIAATDLFVILKKFVAEYSKNHYLVYMTIIQKTEFGKISKCLIKRHDFIDSRVQRAEINRSIEDLVRDGFISYEVGKMQENDKCPQRFFTLTTPCI
ncbi:MAG: hypothetical protein HQK53_19965 [Oligoflexia bacterium]|nr:hypothetical protein [Oligoflexia bacterium]